MDSNLSLSDIAAVTRNNEGFGDGNGWWIILILLFALGGNGFGYGNNGLYGRTATVEDVNNSANFTRLEDQLRGITYGISDSTYALNNAISNLGYRDLENYSNLRYESALGNKDIISAIQSCCCTTQKAIADEGAATRELIQTNKIEALRDKVQALELQAAMFGTVKYPTNYSYSAGPSPFCYNGCSGSYNI